LPIASVQGVITTYGFSIATPNKDLRQTAIDAVFRWLDEVHPHEKRTNSTPVNIRHSPNDAIFRVDVLEQDSKQAAARGTTITLITSKDELYFDLRRTLRPTKSALLPRRTIDRPEPRLNKLILEIVKLFKVRDAEKIIDGEITIANDQLSGQSLAAFAEAPSRRLPILIEVIVGKPAAITSSATAKQLAGIAHLAHVSSHVADEAFNNLYGAKAIGSGWITIIWPRGAAPEKFHQQDDDEVVNQLIAASVGSLATLVLSQSRKIVQAEKSKQEPKTEISSSQSGLQQENIELNNTVKELLEENANLLENATLTDMLSAQKTEERDRAYSQLATFLMMEDDKSYLDRVSDAVAFAQKNLSNIIFHQRAVSSANESHLMNGRRIYSNLVELNNLAARLQRGDFAPNVFNIYCNQQLSNFAASISDEAEHRYAQDYAIEWKGENVLAKPHIRCGDARIHFYHDIKTNEIVIAHVGRHLRDKSTN
jgi:regulator of replication initiation timing